MPWNPDIYNQFRKDRYLPFYDLIALVQNNPEMSILDLGCGTGELTKVLAEKFSHQSVVGIDSSEEMLSKTPKLEKVNFKHKSIEKILNENAKWDLIVANASLQWVDDHRKIFNEIISKLNPKGQIAVQMPSQNENILNQILLQLVQKEPYRSALNGYVRISPVLSLDEYTDLFFRRNYKELNLFQKVYPLVTENNQELFEFISGSSLIPYMERFSDDLKKKFRTDFKSEVNLVFHTHPSVYAFKRILMYAAF